MLNRPIYLYFFYSGARITYGDCYTSNCLCLCPCIVFYLIVNLHIFCFIVLHYLFPVECTSIASSNVARIAFIAICMLLFSFENVDYNSCVMYLFLWSVVQSRKRSRLTQQAYIKFFNIQKRV